MSHRLVDTNCRCGAPGICDCPVLLRSEADNFLTHFDFTSLNELDPSLQGGLWDLIYEREVPVEVIIASDDHGHRMVPGVVDNYTVKILVMGSTQEPTEVKLELSSEQDIFAHFKHSVDLKLYVAIQADQALKADFEAYPSILMKMFNSCIANPGTFLCTLTVADGTARLDFIQNLEYKYAELLSIDLIQSCEDTVRKIVSYKYSALKTKFALAIARLQDISSIVRARNPALMKQIHKQALERCARFVKQKGSIDSIVNDADLVDYMQEY